MTHLPLAWAEAPLSSLLAEPLANGRSVPDGEGFPVLRLGALREDAIDFSERKLGSWSEVEAEPFLVKGGDLLVARGNGSLRLVGRARLVPSNPPEVAFPDTMIRVRPRVEVVHPRFLAIQWEAPRTRSQVERAARTTAGIYKVSQGDLRDLQMVVPPLDEQHRIVAAIETHFSRLDAAVATLTRAKANVKRARASVLKAAVEGRLVPTEAALARAEGRAEGPEWEPASVLLDRILAERKAAWAASGARGKYAEPAKPESEGLPGLPEGWCWASGEQVSDGVESGTTPTKEHFVEGPGVPFIKVYHLTFTRNLDFLHNRPTYVESSHHKSRMQRSATRPGDVLTNIVGPPLGKVSVVSDAFPEWNINQAIARFRPLPGLQRHYLASYLESTVAQAWLADTAKTTTSQVNLAITTCRRLPVPLPPLAEQHRIVAEVDRRLSVLDALDATLDANLARCDRLRQAVLKRAFEGRLVPSEAPAVETRLSDVAR